MTPERPRSRLGSMLVFAGLPQDRSGFVRRQCRWCQRHFKLRPGMEDGVAVQRWASRTVSALAPEALDLEHLRCPYCSRAGTREDWLTGPQRARIERMGQRLRGEMTYASLCQLTEGLGHTARPTVLPVAPEPLTPGLGTEPDDLSRVWLLCCEAEVKVQADWDGDLCCPHCGTMHERPAPKREVKLTFLPE